MSLLFVERQVVTWTQELKQLSDISDTHPQAAYAAFTHGLLVNGIS